MVLLHVSLGRPRLLLLSDAQISAVLEMLPGLVLKTCPIHLHPLTRMRADTGILPTQ